MADFTLKKPKAYKQATYTAPFFETDASKGVFLGNPHIDNLMQMVYALGTEIWVDRQRNRIVESLLAQKKEVTADSIEQYVPTDAERTAWQTEQDAMVHRIYVVLARDTTAVRPFAQARKLTKADEM